MSTIKDLARIVADRYDLSRQDSESFIYDMFEIVRTTLTKEDSVKIKGLGTFKIQRVRERASVNVNTGEKVIIDSHDRISFTPDNAMRDSVNKPFAHFDTVTLNDGVLFDDIDSETENNAAEDSGGMANGVMPIVYDPEVELAKLPDAIPEEREEKYGAVETERASMRHIPQEPRGIQMLVEPVLEERPAVSAISEEDAPEDPESISHSPVIAIQEEKPEEERCVEPGSEEAENVVETVSDTTEEQPIGCPIGREEEETLSEAIDKERRTVLSLEKPSEDSESPKGNADTKKTDEESGTKRVGGQGHDDGNGAGDDDTKDEGKSFSAVMSVLLFVLVFVIGIVIGRATADITLDDICSAICGEKNTEEVSEKEDTITVKADTMPSSAKNSIVKEEPVLLEENSAEPDTEKKDGENMSIIQKENAKGSSSTAEPIVTNSQGDGKKVKNDKGNAENSEWRRDKYDNDVRIRTGAYYIAGIKEVVTARKGQTLSGLSKYYLGAGMECYMEALNGSGEIREGQKVKIPELKLRKKREN